MNKISVLNNPNMYYATVYEMEQKALPKEPVFAVCEGETIVHTSQPFHSISQERTVEMMDDIDKAIVEEVARSKYLTSLQIFEFLSMRGYRVKRDNLRKKILKLMKYRMIQEYTILKEGAERGLNYYELDVKGYLFAREQGVEFHIGNRYLSFQKKMEKGIVVTPTDVKRVLTGNQIVLGMLMNGAKIKRFGIMETFVPEREERITDGCIMRTAANVKIDEDSVLAYEVVRDTLEAYPKLADKVERYYTLLNTKDYLVQNRHKDSSLPQLVICGESLEHNKKIFQFLKEKGLLRENDPILFTEDLLNIKHSLKSLYEVKEEGLCWYGIPKREEEYNEKEYLYREIG